MKKTSKKLLSWVLTLTMVLSLAPAALAAPATEDTTATVGAYTIAVPKGADLKGANESTEVTELTSSQMYVIHEPGWYVVKTDITIAGYIGFSGSGDDVNIILLDDATLTVNGSFEASEKNVSIWGLSGGTGKLQVTSNRPYFSAFNAKSLTVNGGSVDASSIPTNGGNGINVTDLIVNGGSVTAQCSGSSYQGIKVTNNLTLNGVPVVKTGTSSSDATAVTLASGETWKDKLSPASNAPKYVCIACTHTHAATAPGGAITFDKPLSATGGALAAGNYFLADDVTLTSNITISSGTVNLCLNGHVLKGTGSGSVITVENGATLNLYDCGSTQHKFTPNENGLWVLDEASGTKTLTGGCITGGNDVSFTGGVKVTRDAMTSSVGSVFNMYGGNIVGNQSEYGGGGVLANVTSTFTMNGGQIIGNYSHSRIGGVYISSSTFKMSGGSITQNTGASIGGVSTDDMTSIIGGTAVIKDNYKVGSSIPSNFYLYKTITLGTGENGVPVPAEGMEVHVTHNEEMTVAATASADDAKYFCAEAYNNQEYTIVYDSGAIKLVRVYGISATEPTNGTYTITVDAVAVTKAASGQTVTITPTPDTGYEVDNITVKDADSGDVTVTNNAFTMPAKAVTVTVTFKPLTYAINMGSPTHGTAVAKVDGATVTKAAAGASVTVVPTPATGYEVESITVKDADDQSVTVTDSTFTMPAKAVTVAVTFKSSGGSYGGFYSGPATYSVIVPAPVENGAVSADKQSASTGDTVTITVAPEQHCTLDTLTVKDSKGNALELTRVDDTTYTFRMPNGKVEISATFQKFEMKFSDVAEDAYYFDAVLWAAENGITSGTSETAFSPNGITTRAQVVTFLWRAAGCPEPKSMDSFDDVAADSFYAKAVAWAVENGITSGVGGNRFAPDADCTRGQIVTFLYRFNGVDTLNIKDNPFTDVTEGQFYYDAVLWAAENGVTSGTSDTTFSPADTCTRGQTVTFLYRLLVK